MNKKLFSLIALFSIMSVLLPSCKKENPSILKIYVRSTKGILVPSTKVRIVGDISKDTPEYLKEERTNEQGVATFKLDDLFDKYAKDKEKVAYFTVYAKDTSLYYTTITARAKANMTYTSTINLKEQ